MDANPAAWIDTTRDMYLAMLGAVPPTAMARGGFLVGEASAHNADGEAVYACFDNIGVPRARYMTRAEFDAWARL